MGAHEKLERIISSTPRQKIIGTLIFIAVVAAVLLGVFWYGTTKGHEWADSEYIAERDKNLAEIARHEYNERQFAAENALLKKQNEAAAEMLSAADKKRSLDGAKKLAEITAKQNKRNAEIDLDKNFDSQLCQMCAEMSRAGYPLSKQTCQRCEVP